MTTNVKKTVFKAKNVNDQVDVNVNVNTYVNDVNESQIVSLLESYGLEVKGKYIYKKSQRNRGEVAGNFNSNSIYFHASQGIHPFEPNKTYFFNQLAKEFSGTIETFPKGKQHVKKAIIERKGISFDEYLKTVNQDHNFNLQKVIDQFHSKHFNSLIPVPSRWENDNFINGKDGQTYFPVIDQYERFITAQVIPYKFNLKRNKDRNIWYLKANDKIGIYRRSLYDETKQSIIVESPKLAELGALLFNKFNWFATIGKQNFERKDFSFLDPQRTYILPDFDGFDEWQEIAVSKWDFKVIDIFQNKVAGINESERYSDLADFITEYLQGDFSNLKTFYDIYSSLTYLSLEDDFLINISNPVKKVSESMFDFKKKLNFKYFNAIPLDFCDTGANYKQSAESTDFKQDKYFRLYGDKFEIISASFDCRKIKDFKGKKYTETDFYKELENSFRVVRYLNKDHYPLLFKMILDNIQENGNYLFNQGYVLNTLVPQWEKIDPLCIEDLIKIRDWNYTGGGDFDNYAFLKELRISKRKYKDLERLKTIKYGIENGYQFISREAVGITRNSGHNYILDLIKRYNLASIGGFSETYFKHYESYFNLAQKNAHTIYNELYSMHKKVRRSDLRAYSKDLNISTAPLKTLISFKKNKEAIRLILEEITDLIDNIFLIQYDSEVINGKHYLSLVPGELTVKEFIPYSQLANEFKNSLDSNFLTGSVLYCEIEEAISKGEVFLSDWCKFNAYNIDESIDFHKALQKQDIARTYFNDLFTEIKQPIYIEDGF